MKIKAYVLAADPAWMEVCVLSYYDMVEEIIVSYDENGLGWTGLPMPIDHCLQRLRAIDFDGKMRFRPGHYARTEYAPMVNETYQRQICVDEASQGADWVLQLDTDEAIADVPTFLSCLRQAEREGFPAMRYPARWLYKQLKGLWFLEMCSRRWRLTGGFPGPVAIKAGMQLTQARFCDVPTFHVDFRARCTSLTNERLRDVTVNRIIGPESAIIHYSWVRSEKELRDKTVSWGHARDQDYTRDIDRWVWCGKHPFLTMLTTPLRGLGQRKNLRIARLRAHRKLVAAFKKRTRSAANRRAGSAINS